MAGKPQNIFERRRLTPKQLHAVAEYRFDDAMCLLESGDNNCSNGAMYMGGFVIECLLKALILTRYPNLQQAVDPAKLSKRDRKMFDLLYGHELDAMLSALPDVERKLARETDPAGMQLLRRLRGICEQWTIYVRYSSKMAKIEEARRFVQTVGEVKRWLKEF